MSMGEGIRRWSVSEKNEMGTVLLVRFLLRSLGRGGE